MKCPCHVPTPGRQYCDVCTKILRRYQAQEWFEASQLEQQGGILWTTDAVLVSIEAVINTAGGLIGLKPRQGTKERRTV